MNLVINELSLDTFKKFMTSLKLESTYQILDERIDNQSLERAFEVQITYNEQYDVFFEMTPQKMYDLEVFYPFLFHDVESFYRVIAKLYYIKNTGTLQTDLSYLDYFFSHRPERTFLKHDSFDVDDYFHQHEIDVLAYRSSQLYVQVFQEFKDEMTFSVIVIHENKGLVRHTFLYVKEVMDYLVDLFSGKIVYMLKKRRLIGDVYYKTLNMNHKADLRYYQKNQLRLNNKMLTF